MLDKQGNEASSGMSRQRRQRRHRGRPARLVVGTLVFVAVAIAGCGTPATPASQVIPSDAQKVVVTASNFKWTLSRKTFAANRPIDFEVRATENAHGFSIDGTKIRHDVVQGQPPVNLVWTPPKPGQYTIRCDVPCGSGHYNMSTHITVK
ncbi:hypothetical protein [Alicyclobacillus sp. ALC3]|uniref:hypothetical protein n=1 Tax=Alicyclobacillus sp. ALC3 TaxID=2796143 RepID=UPI002379CEAD|nr:hypothetical protein [Alicyclobacillus sp. ALC3]WDL98068.1 hypothetical protein JC200_05015 [Alicyclobacillus sp. ALC3]